MALRVSILTPAFVTGWVLSPTSWEAAGPGRLQVCLLQASPVGAGRSGRHPGDRGAGAGGCSPEPCWPRGRIEHRSASVWPRTPQARTAALPQDHVLAPPCAPFRSQALVTHRQGPQARCFSPESPAVSAAGSQPCTATLPRLGFATARPPLGRTGVAQWPTGVRKSGARRPRPPSALLPVASMRGGLAQSRLAECQTPGAFPLSGQGNPPTFSGPQYPHLCSSVDVLQWVPDADWLFSAASWQKEKNNSYLRLLVKLVLCH